MSKSVPEPVANEGAIESLPPPRKKRSRTVRSDAEAHGPAARNGAQRGKRKKSEAKYRAILEAAAKVFKNKGYARATLSEIGKKASTFAGSMYYHFSSKEDLVEEVLNLGTTEVFRAVVAAVDALPPNVSNLVRIRTAFRIHLNQMLLKDDFIVAYWRIIDQVPADVRSRHLRKPREYGDYWRKLIAAAVDAGEIKAGTHETLMRLVLIGTSIYALDWYSPRGGMDPDDIAEAVLDMIFYGVAMEASAASNTGIDASGETAPQVRRPARRSLPAAKPAP